MMAPAEGVGGVAAGGSDAKGGRWFAQPPGPAHEASAESDAAGGGAGGEQAAAAEGDSSVQHVT